MCNLSQGIREDGIAIGEMRGKAIDKTIALGDETTKIFLNTAGTKRDVSRELKEFLNYVAGKKSQDSFVMKLDDAVKRAKKNREWRHEYMTLLMRDQENLEKGIALGIEQGIERGIEQGIERGIEQGAEREGTRIVVRLYWNGFTTEQIADLTGKDVQKIKEIIEREA